MKRLTLILIGICSIFVAGAAESADLYQALSGGGLTSQWGAEMRGGYAFTSNNALLDRMLPNGSVTHSALGWHLRYAFSLPGKSCSTYQGIGLSVNTFMQSRAIGTPAGIYVFQGAPFAVVNERLSFEYEWNFGATFGWKKTSSGDDVHSNLVVGSSTNAYLNLGFMARYAVSGPLALTAGLDLSHYSNGNTSWPNPGVNSVGARIGLTYTPGSRLKARSTPFGADTDFTQGISYDLMAYGAWRKAYYPAEDGAFTEEGEQALLPGHFGVGGLTFAPMYDIHPAFRAGLSADLQWAENTGLKPYHIPGTYGEDAKFTRPPFFKQMSVGLSARAELVMPIFALNVGIGYGLVGPSETRRLYQVIALKTYVYGPVYLNIGYRLVEFHSPSNLMLGVGITLGR